METLPPPPGVIGSLKTGFDTIATHLTVLLLPLALDLLLWLGPHLSSEQMLQPALQEMENIATSSGFSAQEIQQALDVYKTAIHQFNWLSLLRTFPIGVFSLMSGRMPTQSPWGTPPVIQVDSFFSLIIWIITLTLVGWVLGGIYFHWVGQITRLNPTERISPASAIANTFLLSVLWLALSFLVGIPALLVLTILFAIHPVLGQIALLVMGFLALWIAVPLFFSPHGIFLHGQNALTSVWNSLRLARFTLPTSSLFVLSVILISTGMNYLWSIPPQDSWVTLVGILGHAFIATGLLAASFIYYRDMNTWIQTVFERLRTGTATPQA
ncbi:MAG: hypothetical protein ACP5QU_04805 [Anaerolineae bacterium]